MRSAARSAASLPSTIGRGGCSRGAICRDHAQPLDHDGERIGAVASDGPNAATALELCSTQLGLLVHHAHARELAAATHEEAMRMTFAELTEHNQRLQRALARLEELDRLKSNFLATMSHELRTPLTSVIGYAEMMAEGLAGPITGEQHDYLDDHPVQGRSAARHDHRRARCRIPRVDASSRSSAARCRSSDIVATEVATLRAAGRPSAASRSRSSTRGRARVVLGDTKKIRQIVVEPGLERGQVHARTTATSAIAVRPGPLVARHEDSTSAAVQLVVSDSGIGISRDQVAKIFEPFFQVDSSSTRAFGGTGLGLTLAKAYVEAHGGRIWVDTYAGSRLDVRRELSAAPRGCAPRRAPRARGGRLTEPSVAIALAALCVLVSGFCSGTEVALFSLRRVDREQLAH